MRRNLAVLAGSLALTFSGACTEGEPRLAGTTTTENAGCARDLVACARETSIGPAVPEHPGRADGQPIRLGMMNQEQAPVGSFPEMSRAARAAMDFVNEELGGIDGRPLELDLCDTSFSAEGSQACAQRFVEERVPAVVGAIDLFGNGIDILADNGIPFVGGIPVSTPSVSSATSFQFSGGTWGAAIAFAHYAVTELDADRVAIVYADFGPISEAADYGTRVLEAAEVDVVNVPFPAVSTELTSPLQAANADNPDAIVVLTADAGCKAAFDAAASLQVTAQLFFVGACFAPSILSETGIEKTEGVILNSEGLVGADAADLQLYNAVVARYGNGLDAQTAGALSFRALMNLYAVLRDLGADAITPAAITAAFRAGRDVPSFAGYPYTCDGEQLEGLPAICSPQQELLQVRDGELVAVTGWLQVGEIYSDAKH